MATGRRITARKTDSKRCPWPTCNRIIRGTSALCFEHSRYVTHALKTLPRKVAAHLKARIEALGPYTLAAINGIRVEEYARNLSYLSDKWNHDRDRQMGVGEW